MAKKLTPKQKDLLKKINAMMKSLTEEQLQEVFTLSVAMDGVAFASRQIDLAISNDDKIYWANRMAVWNSHFINDSNNLRTALMAKAQ
jgi:hypothetical protein